MSVIRLTCIFTLIINFFNCGTGSEKYNDSTNKLPILVTENFEDKDIDKLMMFPPENWEFKQEEQSQVLSLREPGPEREDIRGPQAYALLKDYDVTDFVFTGKMKCYEDTLTSARDMVVVFHYIDQTHFYYVHFSKSSGRVHNIMGLVNGKDRVKINHEPIGETIPRLVDYEFHDFKVSYNSKSGDIKAYLDEMNTPIITATDTTLSHGLVGVGSFDDYGCYDDIQLRGETVSPQ